MKRRKIGVVGAGFVGATTAQRLAERNVADVGLVDIMEGIPQGKALDLEEAGPVVGYGSRVAGSQGYDVLAGSEVVVVTAGLPRKPGMTRDDLLKKNAEIVGGVVDQVKRVAPDCVLVVVSNPLDAMTYLAYRRTGWPRERVIGMAGVLDSSRFRSFIAMELGVSLRDVQAMVLGGHGDTMVPVARYATVSGIPITELLPQAAIDRMTQRTRDGGVEIVNLLKTGSAFYAPSASVVAMVEAILLDEKRVLPCCVNLKGEYGLKDVFVGVPVVLGGRGVEKVLELKLAPEELKALNASADHVRETCGALDRVTAAV